MDVSRKKFTRKTILLPIAGLAAFFLYILLFNVDIVQVLNTARTANPLIYSAAAFVSLAEVFFYAVTWQSMLNYLKVKISIIRSYLFVWYGTFLDIMIPAESISGELCRVYLVNREQCGTSGKVVASVVTQRILGMGMNVLFLLLGVYLLTIEAQVNPIIFSLILFIAATIAAIMGALLVVSAKENWSKKAITCLINFGQWITRGKWRQLSEIKEQALTDAVVFHESMKEFGRKPQSLILPTAWSAANWLCSMAVPYLVFLSLGYQIPWGIVLITGSIVVAVKAIPIGIPFEVGLPEITMTTLYTSMGVPPPIGATATILSRIITLWLRFGIGFASQQWIELKPLVCINNQHVAQKT